MILVNHYKVLGVHKLSTEAEIKEAHRKLASPLHPDHTGNDPLKAAKMTELNVSYNVLKQEKTRKEFDKQLALFGGKCPTCEGAAYVVKQKGFSKKIKTPCPACAGCGVV